MKGYRGSKNSSPCCRTSNVLLFALIGFIVFYICVGVYMFQDASAHTHTKELDKIHKETETFQTLQPGLRKVVVTQPSHTDIPSTIAKDGIDDAVTAVVSCTTSQGNVTIDVRGKWAPLGAEQFLHLVDNNMFTDLPFFRVCPRYISTCTL